MKVAVFRYDYSQNIGDDVQTLAVAQHLARVDLTLDRDSLHAYAGDPCVVVMNGWFSHRPANWPPSDAVTPVFFGFHMTPAAAKAYRAHADYFKRFAPIGCRDEGTAAALREWGVDAYWSGCATLTFPRRAAPPADGVDLLVDCPKSLFRSGQSALRTGTHFVADIAADAKAAYAKALLAHYRDRVRRLVTSRIHCAMPCAAMGVPVVYLGEQDYRTDVISLIGMKATKRPRLSRLDFERLDFFTADFSEAKRRIAGDLRARLDAAGVPLANWSVDMAEAA